MRLIATAILVIALTPAIAAHHSFTAQFDSNSPVKITGTIAGVRWANPHAWIYVEVKETNGEVVKWAIEMVAANQLYRRGWRAEDAPVGAQLTVTGWRARNGTPTANADTMTLADGRRIFAGDAPERSSR